MLINGGTLGAGIKELKPGAAAPPTLNIFGYFSTGKRWAILDKFLDTIWAGNLKKIWQH